MEAVLLEGVDRWFRREDRAVGRAAMVVLAACFVALLLLSGLVSVGAAPTGDQIAARVIEKLKQIQTVQADIVAEFSEGPGKSVVKMGIRVTADRAAKLTRMEITQHPAFEGQIMILDTKNDQATVYMPVTGQAFRGKTASIAAQLGFDLGTLDLNELLSMDPKNLLSCTFLRQETINRLPYYVVETRPKVAEAGPGVQLVWVDAETYIVYKVEMYDAEGSKVASVTFDSFQIDIKLDANKIKELPRGTKVTEIK